jgi:hypothetical protein
VIGIVIPHDVDYHGTRPDFKVEEDLAGDRGSSGRESCRHPRIAVTRLVAPPGRKWRCGPRVGRWIDAQPSRTQRDRHPARGGRGCAQDAVEAIKPS